MTSQIRALPGRRSLLTTALGRHLTVSVPAADLLEALRTESPAAAPLAERIAADAAAADAAVFSGEDLVPSPGDGVCEPAETGAVEADARAAGVCAAGADAEAGSSRHTSRTFVVAGDAELASAVAGALRVRGAEVVDGPADRFQAIYAAFDARVPLVWCTRESDRAGLVDLDRLAHDFRISWIAVSLELGRLLVGPAVEPGVGAVYEDFALRATAAALDLDVHRALCAPALSGDLPSAADYGQQIGWAAGALAAGLAPDTVLAADRRTGRAHTVLPMADREVERPVHTAADLESDLCGIVTRVRSITHEAELPESLTTLQSEAADLRRVSDYSNTRVNQGSAFGDAAGARAAAVGEAVERYCCNVLRPDDSRRGSYAELRRSGLPVLDPRELVLYSPAQYAAPGFPFVPLDDDLVVDWVPARVVDPATATADGEEVWVPASLVYVNWHTGARVGLPHTNFCAFAGIAAGPTWEFAVVSGLEEVIERHITMAWWLNAHPLPGVDLTAPEAAGVVAPFAELLERGECELDLIPLDSEFGVPVAAAVVRHLADDLVNVGFSARPTLEAAALKAFTEALTLQAGSRDLLDPSGAHWSALAAGRLSGRSYKPYRADRRYLDDFRPDFHDVDDLMVQQQVYLDPRARERVARLLHPPAIRSLADVPSLPDRSLASYAAAVERAGMRILTVDLTTPDIAQTGMRVVRTLVPGTIGNAPAAFPFLGDGAVTRYAVDRGWRDAPLDESELLAMPMPHA